MRTIRDMAVKRGMMDEKFWDMLDGNGNITVKKYKQINYISEEEMQELIDSYNEAPHRSIGKAPNDFNSDDEMEYIKRMRLTTNPYKFKEGDKVRIVMEKNKLGKNRFTVSPKAYTVDSRVGNQFNIRAQDNSVSTYPGYKIVKAKGKVPYANTLKNGKRGVVIEILKYSEKTNKYKVKYEGGVEDWILPKSLREGTPAKLSRIEREYWVNESKKNKPIPNNIKKWF